MECAVSDTMRLTAPLPGNGGGAVFYWYALSGAYAPAVPLFGFAIFPRPGEIFPKGGAFGKEINFAWTAKASHFERLPRPGEVARKCQKGARWHCEAMTERARMLTKSKKHSDTISVCQRHRIAVFLCFILSDLPSQALTRQLSQRESLWHNLKRMQNTSSHPAHWPRAK